MLIYKDGIKEYVPHFCVHFFIIYNTSNIVILNNVMQFKRIDIVKISNFVQPIMPNFCLDCLSFKVLQDNMLHIQEGSSVFQLT